MDAVMILTACISLTIILLIIVLLIRSLISSSKHVPAQDSDEQRPRAIPINREDAGQRRGGRNIRARMRAAAARQVEDEDDEEVDPLAEEIALPDGKLGAKKRKKLEMKAEKRAQRERDLEEREERKQRQAMLDEQRKIEDEKKRQEELQREEEEKKLREEKEQQEYEEYLKLKESFEIQEEGCDDEDNDENSSKNKLQEFINYVKNKKVVLLEDLASQFQLKTQDCIDRVQDLLLQEQLVGVIDDRGKFIYITHNELEAVAKFIKQRGRVSLNELVEHSNTLINLQTDVKCEA